MSNIEYLSISGNASYSDEKGQLSPRGVQARRNGSSANIIAGKDGSLKVERRTSGADLLVAVQKRLSQSSLPTINIFPAPVGSEPLIDAQDALERTGGKGAAGSFVEHLWPVDVITDKYFCHIDLQDERNSRGLTTEKAGELLAEFGQNVLTPPPRVPLWLLFLLQFTNLLMILLMICAIFCLILYGVTGVVTNLYLGILLWIAVIVTCYETFSQEAKSDQLMEKFRNMIPAAADVIRDGNMCPMPTQNIVPGDLIRLKSGDKIPADCRIIYNQSLKVDQAMITGESEPVDSTVIAASQLSLEAKNIIFNGSLVVDGSCLAVAIRTGDASLIGTMVSLTGDVEGNISTLKVDIEYFVKYLTVFALAQAVSVFIAGGVRKLDLMQTFLNGFIVIMLGNVPQGLPSTVTACLYIVAERMTSYNVFVKKLDIIETLGSCSLICTDKTGTLTMNEMSVANLWCFNSGDNSSAFFKSVSSEASNVSKQMRVLMDVATLCSRVMLEKKTEDDEAKPNGDATELGLYKFFGSCISFVTGKSIEEYRSYNAKVHEIPFNSSNKWQMSIHNMASESDGKQHLLLKGAPDVLLQKCSRYLASDGSVLPIDDAFSSIYQQVYEEFGGNGERVLGFCMLPFDRTIDEEIKREPLFKDLLKERLVGKGLNIDAGKVAPIRDLIFVGLITLMDPPRPEVPQAIKDCHTAGVKVVMVTGDHPLTAQAIARKIGLITHPTRGDLEKRLKEESIPFTEDDVKAVVVAGSQIPDMTEQDWKLLVSKQEIVFARTSPEQKLKIVKEFTKAGNITAMTGDGVNDSPALKQAAIGVAMGKNGSDVAREAADIVLLDDNFASIVIGIREGRLLYANLKKSIAYTLSHLPPEVMPVLLWAFVGTPQPMGSLLCICIDLCTELLPATSLAFEKPETSIMKVPPRNPAIDKLTSPSLLLYSYGFAGMVEMGCCLFTFFRMFAYYGISARQLFTMDSKFFPSANGDSVHTTLGKDRIYDPDEQDAIFNHVQAAWFLQIVCCQAVHIMVCRTTTVSIFEHGVFSNSYANYGLITGVALGIFITYCPGLQEIVLTDDPKSLDIFFATIICIGILWPCTELRKLFSRRYPDHALNKWLVW